MNRMSRIVRIPPPMRHVGPRRHTLSPGTGAHTPASGEAERKLQSVAPH
jgi:hypothetical protein